MSTVSGIVTLPYRALIESGLQSALNQCTALYGSLQIVTIPDTVGNPLSISALYGSLQSVTIPDTVDIQFRSS